MANHLDSLLDVAAELKTRGRKGITLLLVGQGGQKPRLINRGSERRGLDNIVFYDPISKLELAGLMAGADLGLQVLGNVPAFYFGTSPNKFFDYISAGLR